MSQARTCNTNFSSLEFNFRCLSVFVFIGFVEFFVYFQIFVIQLLVLNLVATIFMAKDAAETAREL